MNQHYFFFKNLIRFTTVLITINTVLGIAPLDVFPNLSQSVQAQDNIETILERSADKFNKEDYLGAIKDLTEAIRLDPNNAQAYWLRELSYTYSGNFEKAIKDCNQALKLDPKEDCNQALKINPNYAEAYYNRGIAKSE